MTAPARTTKAYRHGTHRTRTPEQTWDIVAPKLERFGVTRVADVTDLDAIGIPVMMAVRPLSKTLSVTQGKGQTTLLARISAVMEAIEDWHADFAHPPVTHSGIPAAECDLPYDLAGLPQLTGSLLAPAMSLDWIAAVGLATGTRTMVPEEVVCCGGRVAARWTPTGLLWNSNGLASGNCWEEAALHGLYEILERDAVSLASRAGSGIDIDPASVTDPACGDLLRRIRSAGATVRITRMPSRVGVPCFVVWIWSPDFPLPMLGCGANLTPEIALSRAITEAAQTRLTGIAASRDDLDADFYAGLRAGSAGLAAGRRKAVPWAEAGVAGPVFDDVAAELRWLCDRTMQTIGAEPLLVDLSVDPDIAVVRVLVPGAVFDMAEVHPTAEFAEPDAD